MAKPKAILFAVVRLAHSIAVFEPVPQNYLAIFDFGTKGEGERTDFLSGHRFSAVHASENGECVAKCKCVGFTALANLSAKHVARFRTRMVRS